MSKTPPGHGTTRVATQPYKVILIYFLFSWMIYDYSDLKTIYEGINGETFWILITDHCNGMNHGDARIYKASPIAWLRHLPNQYSPTCNDKYIHLDNGGELFDKPYVNKLLQ